MRKLTTGLLAASLALGSAILAAEAPPATRTVSDVDRQFGMTLPDPYRWMEGAQNPEFAAWLSSQGQYTRRQLDALPSLQSWREIGRASCRERV